MKKLRQKAPLIVLIALLLIPTLFITMTTLANNHTENQFAKQLFDIKLPDNTAKVQELHFRVGDKEAQKTEFYAILLIRSDLDYPAIQEHYSNSNFGSLYQKSTVQAQVEKMAKIDLRYYESLKNLTHRKYGDTMPYETYYEITISDVGELSLFDLALYK